MKRSSQHILKFSNINKLNDINDFYNNYKNNLIYYIDLILNQNLELKSNLSSKYLPVFNIESSRWRQNIYKQASEIVRSNIKNTKNKRYNKYKKIYKYFKEKHPEHEFTNKRFKELNLKNILDEIKIEIKDISINIDERFLNYNDESKYFNEFIGIRIPINNGNVKTKNIKVPIKYHKQSLKYKNWERKKTIQLKKINNNFYLKFIYEKEDVPVKNGNRGIGIDIGYNKLISDSNGNFYGKELKEIYNKISRKERGSKKYKRSLKEKENKINEVVNTFINKNKDIDVIYLEDLYKVKNKSKFSKKMNNKLQYWSYRQVISKLELIEKEHGIKMEKVSPAYTSQKCSKCGVVDKSHRSGEIYKCSRCGNEIDSDTNGSINIFQRGFYSTSSTKNKLMNIFQ